MPAILDVAIGTIFVFLLFSIVVTALNEVVLTLFDKRADFLRLGLGELLSDPQQLNVKGYREKALKLLADTWQQYWAWVLGGLAVLGTGLSASLSAAIAAAQSNAVWGWALFVILATVIAASIAREAEQVAAAQALAEKVAAEKAAAVKTAAPQAALTAVPKAITVDSIFQHPLIFSHSKGESDPSYIRASAFSKAVLDLLLPEPGQGGGGAGAANLTALDTDALKEAISNIPNEKLQRSLAALLRSVDGDVDKFKTAVEDWFNHSMERVTGWYKRHAQTWLLILGFALAVVCNVDAVKIIQTLSRNPNLAHSVAAQAEAYGKANNAPPSTQDLNTAQEAKEQKITAAKAKVAAAKAAMDPQKLLDAKTKVDQATADAKAQAQAQFDQVKQAMAQGPQELIDAQQELAAAYNWDGVLADFKKDLQTLSMTGIPMGWTEGQFKELGLLKATPAAGQSLWKNLQTDPAQWYWIALIPMVCGWGLTTLAASLGAPFWFDLLQRVMNLRANGRAPEEKDLNSKKDDTKKDATPKTDATTTPA